MRPTSPGHQSQDERGVRFWVTAALGWLIIAVGVRGILLHDVDTRPRSLATFVVGGALLHDLLFAPLVVLGGVLVGRLVAGRARAWVQGALIVTGMLALFAYPLVRGFGRAARNPTSLPRDYGTNLALVVIVGWLALATAALVVTVRRRTRGRGADREGAAGDPSRTDASHR